MTFLELARRVIVSDIDGMPRDNAINEENERNEINQAPANLRIWVCASCAVPRSLEDSPCPNCRAAGITETRGQWLTPPPREAT